MKNFLIFFLLFLSAAPAFACEDHAQTPLEIREFCRQLPNHTLDADVAFQPGLDSKGRAVLPADINTPLQTPILPLQIPVTIDLAQRAALDLPADTDLETPVAILNIYEDGRVDYNGHDITSNAYTLCKTLNHDQPPETGQKTEDRHHTNP